jgi:hypothetical protein
MISTRYQTTYEAAHLEEHELCATLMLTKKLGYGSCKLTPKITVKIFFTSICLISSLYIIVFTGGWMDKWMKILRLFVLVRIGSNCLQSRKVFNDSLSVNKFLGQESGCSKHGKTTVLKFLGLHRKEFIRIQGLQAKRVEIEVSWDVGLTQ